MKVVREVGVYEAKTHFSKLLEHVQNGELLRITKHGKVIAELQAPKEAGKQARFGCASSQSFFMSDDFDAPLEDFQEYM